MIALRITRWCSVFLWLTVMVTTGHAQNPFEDAVKQLTSDNVKGYLQPFVNSLGANLNSGVYHSAAIGGMGLSLRVDIVGMGTLIGDAEKTYSAVPPQPFDQTPVQTATVFGGLGTTVHHPSGIDYQFQNGQVKTSIVPFASPQLTIGNFYGTQAIIRYAPIPKIGDFPKVTLFGIGARHSVSQYLPGVPVDVAVGLFYQTFKVGGEIIDAKTFNFGAQASKSFSILTLYGGLQYETSTMTLSYTYTGPAVPGVPQNSSVNLDLTGENKFRVMGGVGLNLVILNINADINVGKVTVASATVGFGF